MTKIEQDYPSPVQNYDQVPNEVDAYRTALSAAADGSVVIAGTGEPTALRSILTAEPALFAQKAKSLVCISGGGGCSFG